MFYDKKIKYLDYFEDGERVKGGGFVKLEVRDRSLRMEIMVSGLYTNDTFIREVVLCGAGQENILGRMEITRGKGQYQIQCNDLTDIGGTGISYGELQGIRIPLGSSRALSCSWQGQGASAEREEITAAQRAKETAVGRERMSSEKGESTATIGKEMISSAKWEEIPTEKTAMSTDEGKRQDITSQNSTKIEEEKQSATQEAPRSGQEMQAGTQKPLKNEAEKQNKSSWDETGSQAEVQSLTGSKWGEEVTLRKSPESSKGKQMKRSKSGEAGQEKKQKTIFSEGGIQKGTKEDLGGLQEQKMQSNEATEKTIRLLEDKWMQLCAIYPHIRPFRDKREYLSIGPADFVLFPSASYKMVNNSFLLHGYYNYNHLILTRIEQKGEPRYYIGVPGNFFEKEKQVAIMFGFESFECEEEPAQTGDFGYYMMRTEL